jgi:hypothetical protein
MLIWLSFHGEFLYSGGKGWNLADSDVYGNISFSSRSMKSATDVIPVQSIYRLQRRCGGPKETTKDTTGFCEISMK